MNITFLIGNGFDLNCGLKSSYQDVYNEYCKINETDSELIKNFKKNIKNDYKTWGDFELAMAEKINDFKSENDFVKCIIDFKTYLVKYLSEEKRKFFEKYNTDSIKDLSIRIIQIIFLIVYISKFFLVTLITLLFLSIIHVYLMKYLTLLVKSIKENL